jgi:2-methylisocitrate lyase-like PEP mutase family enzyme
MKLNYLLEKENILIAPGIFDGLSAHMAEQAGANLVYLSGASLAYTRFGLPDIGLISMSEVSETISVIRDRVNLPIIVDADNGFGNALNVQRTVKNFERMGANAIQIEDQISPKRCGHLKDKKLIECTEMVGKIKAACDARRCAETLIVARTDAIAVEGFESAIDRSHKYIKAGADILFIEAPTSKDQMKKITSIFRKEVPLMANMVEGGMSPLLNAKELEKIGYKVVIFPGGLVRAIAKLSKNYFSNLLLNGSNLNFLDSMYKLDHLNQILNT